MQKRYQYIGKGGKKCWTKWFNYDGEQFPYQLKSYGLINEYKE